MDRALSTALSGNLADAEGIATEGLHFSLDTPDGAAAYASRMAALAFRLLNLDHHAEARAVGDLAVQACTVYLESGPERTNPRRAARYLELTGLLLQRTTGDLQEAKEAYLLAYELDPENQIESLRLAQSLEERERVIAERKADEKRREEAQR